MNRADLDYIIGNLQQPPPPPAPPPPPTDAAADRARLIAELDGLAMERERQSRAEMVAQRNAVELAAQRVATPAQQIVHQYHYQPAPQPVIVQPDMSSMTEMMRHYGQSMQQLFLQQQPRAQPEEIPLTMLGGGGGPPPPPGAGAVAVRGGGYGPARMPPERYTPFSGPGSPPPPGGGTAPMPVPARPASARAPLPVKKVEKRAEKARNVKKKGKAEEVEVETGGGPPTAPSSGAARVRTGKRGMPDDFGDGPSFRRFPGRGQRLPDESFPSVGRGPSATAGSLGMSGKRAPPALAVRAGYQPFAGQPQRLDDGGSLREKAIQRMRELGHQHAQRERKTEMLDRQNDLQRAIRRGGARGDVVPLGKRRREDQDAFAPRRRVGERPAGPQRFSIAA